MVATGFAIWVCGLDVDGSGGLLVPRDGLPRFLELVSSVLPLSYAVDAMRAFTTQVDAVADGGRDVAIVAVFVVAAIAHGSLRLRRRTP